MCSTKETLDDETNLTIIVGLLVIPGKRRLFKRLQQLQLCIVTPDHTWVTPTYLVAHGTVKLNALALTSLS